MQQSHYQYDFFIIGGGSGGLSAAKWAASSGAKVGLADFVKPSPQGFKWGLGGTCVNVGCIPKKLLHYTGNVLGENIKDQKVMGWQMKDNISHNWDQMKKKINLFIKELNFTYNTKLRSHYVTYFNSFAKLKSSHQVELRDQKGIIKIVSARYILIATGARPKYPDISGAKQYGITSDDIFWKEKKPGKTLVIGASYIGIQCAGFLNALGINVSILVRSVILRGFDQHMVGKLVQYLQKKGIRFIRNSIVVKLTKGIGSLKKVQIKSLKTNVIQQQEYETVIFAIGRVADTKNLFVNQIGVKTTESGKILVGEDDCTNVSNIYAIGDVVHGRLQLTPSAIMAGKLLAKRLFRNQKNLMSYRYVPITITTSIQYSCCGYSEEDAIKMFGKQNVICFGNQFKPLQWNMNQKKQNDCYAKIIVLNKNNKIMNQVIGMHYIGPYAGQIMQGFAVCIKKGITKQDLQNTVGIYPTIAQQFVLMNSIIGTNYENKSQNY